MDPFRPKLDPDPAQISTRGFAFTGILANISIFFSDLAPLNDTAGIWPLLRSFVEGAGSHMHDPIIIDVFGGFLRLLYRF